MSGARLPKQYSSALLNPMFSWGAPVCFWIETRANWFWSITVQSIINPKCNKFFKTLQNISHLFGFWMGEDRALICIKSGLKRCGFFNPDNSVFSVYLRAKRGRRRRLRGAQRSSFCMYIRNRQQRLKCLKMIVNTSDGTQFFF